MILHHEIVISKLAMLSRWKIIWPSAVLRSVLSFHWSLFILNFSLCRSIKNTDLFLITALKMVAFNLCKMSSKLYGSVLVVAGQSQQFAVRGIASKTMRHRIETVTPKPAPFPYKEKSYNFLRALVDYPTTSRMDENSKLIVVDGPPTSGKGALAKELADELDMAYFDAPTIAKTLFNNYGYDLRKLDSKLPEDCRSYDESDFLKNPKTVKAARMQIKMFQLHFQNYVDALAHILNTGQGVVMNRSVYSNFVFLEAMVANGFVSRNGTD